MKLDVNILRYMSHDEWRTLTAVELGQKNHEIVPTALIETIAKLRHGGTYKALCTCLKYKLLHHDNSKYDGYRLTNLGYDFLAINALRKRGAIASVGRQIGVGKESDLFEVANEEGTVMALKLHRLGRTSFRDVKTKRDYLRRGHHYSWLYLSRLAAIKEFAFMKALGERGLPVPAALDQNRHAVLMEHIDGLPLAQVHALDDPGPVYERMMDIVCGIARLGLVHCDYNEFNVMLGPDRTLTVIDFPQMVSTSHANAAALFRRDVACVRRFFEKKLNYWVDPEDAPDFTELRRDAAAGAAVDGELRASGFDTAGATALASAMQERTAGISNQADISDRPSARVSEESGDCGSVSSLEGSTNGGGAEPRQPLRKAESARRSKAPSAARADATRSLQASARNDSAAAAHGLHCATGSTSAQLLHHPAHAVPGAQHALGSLASSVDSESGCDVPDGLIRTGGSTRRTSTCAGHADAESAAAGAPCRPQCARVCRLLCQ